MKGFFQTGTVLFVCTTTATRFFFSPYGLTLQQARLASPLAPFQAKSPAQKQITDLTSFFSPVLLSPPSFFFFGPAPRRCAFFFSS